MPTPRVLSCGPSCAVTALLLPGPTANSPSPCTPGSCTPECNRVQKLREYLMGFTCFRDKSGDVFLSQGCSWLPAVMEVVRAGPDRLWRFSSQFRVVGSFLAHQEGFHLLGQFSPPAWAAAGLSQHILLYLTTTCFPGEVGCPQHSMRAWRGEINSVLK